MVLKEKLEKALEHLENALEGIEDCEDDDCSFNSGYPNNEQEIEHSDEHIRNARGLIREVVSKIIVRGN